MLTRSQSQGSRGTRRSVSASQDGEDDVFQPATPAVARVRAKRTSSSRVRVRTRRKTTATPQTKARTRSPSETQLSASRSRGGARATPVKTDVSTAVSAAAAAADAAAAVAAVPSSAERCTVASMSSGMSSSDLATPEARVPSPTPTPDSATPSFFAPLRSAAAVSSASPGLLRRARTTPSPAMLSAPPATPDAPEQRSSSSGVAASPAPSLPRGLEAAFARARTRGPAPDAKRVPGTTFLVDGFKFVNPETQSYFLTHFHSDHYCYLTKGFAAGLIYCTPVTAALAHHVLRVPEARMRTIPINGSVVVEGVKVTALDANHCPGAALFLFQLPDGSSHLHTGDMRYHAGMQSNPVLQSLRHTLTTLFLDTTYCEPKYVFPPQATVIKRIADKVDEEMKLLPPGSRMAVLVGSYTIGKERIVVHLAQRFRTPCLLEPRKHQLLKLCAFPDFDRLFTGTDRGADSWLRLVSMGALSYRNMETLATSLTGEGKPFTHVLGFCPTGWSYTGKTAFRCSRWNNVTVYSTPYSEHSSYAELRDMVKFLRPRKLVPTVNFERPEARAQIMKLLQPLCDNSRNRATMIPFLRRSSTSVVDAFEQEERRQRLQQSEEGRGVLGIRAWMRATTSVVASTVRSMTGRVVVTGTSTTRSTSTTAVPMIVLDDDDDDGGDGDHADDDDDDDDSDRADDDGDRGDSDVDDDSGQDGNDDDGADTIGVAAASESDVLHHGDEDEGDSHAAESATVSEDIDDIEAADEDEDDVLWPTPAQRVAVDPSPCGTQESEIEEFDDDDHDDVDGGDRLLHGIPSHQPVRTQEGADVASESQDGFIPDPPDAGGTLSQTLLQSQSHSHQRRVMALFEKEQAERRTKMKNPLYRIAETQRRQAERKVVDGTSSMRSRQGKRSITSTPVLKGQASLLQFISPSTTPGEPAMPRRKRMRVTPSAEPPVMISLCGDDDPSEDDPGDADMHEACPDL